MKSIILKQGREKSVLRRHPWIFTGAIERIAGEPKSGETVEIVGSDGSWRARASYSPISQIAARIWTFDSEEDVGPEFFRRRLERSISARGALASASAPTAARLCNAESDGLPGIIIDRYAGFIVMQLLTAGAERWREVLIAELARLVPAAGIYERSDVSVRDKEGLPKRSGVMAGAPPPELLEIVEGPCRFLVDPRRGHKTGFYLDQRENRAAAAGFASGASVLNCFCYTGGFGVTALMAGASRVTNVDSSTAALDLARRNFDLNGLAPEQVEYVDGDAFSVLRAWRDERREFDLIVLDPPKFVESTAQLTRAARGYKDINMLAFKLLRQGGLLFTFSCSGLLEPDLFQKIVADAALDAGREAQIVRRLSQASDHPTALSFPEGSYLKGFICRVSG